MSQLKNRKLRLDKARYNLHYRLRKNHPEDALILDPIQRQFSKTLKSTLGLKLVNEFGYSIQTSI